MNFTIRLLIWLRGKFVGADSIGNRYYEEKLKNVYEGSRQRRWIIYKSGNDASKIPPEWHAWLHYRADKPLSGQIFDLKKPKQHSLGETYKQPTIDETNKIVKINTKMRRSYQPWTPNE